MMKLRLAVIGAGARGALAYASYLLHNPHEGEIVGVAEPVESRREAFKEQYNIQNEFVFDTWEKLLAKPKFCDAVIIATQDDMHYAPAIKAMELGYDILLEKPMAPTAAECKAIANKAAETGRKVFVCHVLRYTNFFKEVKRCLDEGQIGNIISVQHNENVGFFHQAHSFVRGNWRNSAETNPMIVAKCCHDMDLLNWLIGKKCLHLSSFGSLSYFKKENAPEGSTNRCLDGCKVADTCPYHVMRYWEERSAHRGFVRMVCNLKESSIENFIEAVKTGPYGRCVFRCDNDVVDHQVVNMEYDNGITVAFTMAAFTNEMTRTFRIMGTKGELLGYMEHNEIKIYDFLTNNTTTIKTSSTSAGHGGGDSGIMRDFLAALRGEPASTSLTTAEVSVDAHLMAFAAEQARLERRVISL